MSFWSYVKTGNFWKQLLLMIVILVLLVAGVLLSLRFFTNHGQDIRVADIRGMYLRDLEPFSKEFGFKFVIRDSVYDPDKEPGEIIAQSPQAGEHVKKNRTFYVVVAASLPASVQMPDLQDLSLRQAEALLETYGLKVGAKFTVPSIVKGAVIGQLYQGEEIEPGSMIRRGSSIDLQIGDGKGKMPVVQDTVAQQEDDMDEDSYEDYELLPEEDVDINEQGEV
ncbi:MAG: PASTA domain-containing protein [Bacteroides sp.]|nr:PASTA domain-containing protein [Ruminococcus flavefaciens]MCM1555037.1 PASTA domain-containing protein [Bacteroides sp.]MCM1555512.1 PASTA domain-containing protein [Bacteroides sp.]